MSSVPPQGPGPMPPPPPPPPQPPYAAPPSGGLPWETKALGPEPFFETVKLFITAPDQAWRLTRETGDFTRPLLFGVIIGWVGLVFRALWGSMFGAPWLRYVPEQYRTYMHGAGGGILVQIILGPIFIALGLFIFAAILHVSFMIVGALKGSRSQFEGTFRLCAYASISNIANVVPVVGGLAGAIWGIYLIVVGAQQLHKTTQGKAVAGVLLPVALCCVCAIVGMAIAGAAIFSAFRR